MMESLYYTQQIEKSDPTNITVDKFMGEFDRALTQEPYVMVSTITGAIEFLQQHPFPEVINRVFNTLSKVFGDKTIIPETKLILHRIVQLTRESKPFIHAYQTPEVMLRSIMIVSHNLDPEMRALCLMLLEALAPIVCNDSHAQHLIIEGLSAPTIIEKMAAVVAVKQFVQHSKQFCELVIQKFEDLLFSAELNANLKVNLIKILPYFRDGVTLCDRIYALGKRLLGEHFEKEVTLAAYDLLTHVAGKGIQVAEHLNFLMDTVDAYENDQVLVTNLFKNLAEICSSSHWETEQVVRLIHFKRLFEKQKSPTAVYYFIKCMNVFTSQSRFMEEVKSADTFLVSLLSHPNFTITVKAARILVNFQDSEAGAITLVNFLPNLIERMSMARPKEQRIMCKILLDYCGSKTTTEEAVKFIIGYLINSTSMESPAFIMILETINAVCAQFPRIYSIGIQFAEKVLNKLLEIVQSQNDVIMDGSYLTKFDPPLYLFSLLLAPEYARGSTALPLADVVKDYGIKVNYALRYDIAVMAFRYGHWKEVALPLLESLELGKLQFTFSSWINSLIYLAKSQLSDFTVKEISLAHMNMKTAQITLENLTLGYDKARFFKFPHAYLEIFTEIVYLLNNFLSLYNVNKILLANNSVYTKRSIASQCKLYRAQSSAVLEKLDALSQRSFDVDNESRAQLVLLRQLFDLIHFAFGFLRISLPSRMPSPYFVEINSPTNAHLLELIGWARSQFSKLYEFENQPWGMRITETNVIFIKDVLFKLLQHSFYLPRAFFQFVYSTKIRLNIKIEGKEVDGRYLVSGVAPFHPVVVEGYVETNNPAGIMSVTVNGSIATISKNGIEPFKPVQQRAVNLAENVNHFSLHFAFHVLHTSKIRFEVTFIDKESKKTWQSNTVEEAIIQIGGT